MSKNIENRVQTKIMTVERGCFKTPIFQTLYLEPLIILFSIHITDISRIFFTPSVRSGFLRQYRNMRGGALQTIEV